MAYAVMITCDFLAVHEFIPDPTYCFCSCSRLLRDATCHALILTDSLQVGSNRWEYDHAKLEGSFRKLAAPNSSQYDDEAYNEALAESLEATKRFVMHTTYVSLAYVSCGKRCFVEARSP